MPKSSRLNGATLEAAARVMNMSQTTVAHAVRVRRFGVPLLVAALERGEIPVATAAKIARLTPHEQRQALAFRGIPRPKVPSGNVNHRRILSDAMEMLEALSFDQLKEAADLISKVKRGER
jgi:hypothetical protein